MKKITEATAATLPPKALKAWREGYRRHLEAKGMSSEEAAGYAAKVTYRADLYPAAGSTPDLFTTEQREPSPATKTKKAAKPATVPEASGQKPATKRENALIAASAEIMGLSPSGNDFAFIHAVMCQVGLPRAKVEGRDFIRRSGNVQIAVSAGLLDTGNGLELQPIPYGPLPRLALTWISTYARRNNTREIPIGHSAAEFLRLMGLDDQGARYAALRKQMHALAACRLQLAYQGRNFDDKPIKQFDAWLSNRDTGQRSFWPGVMVLGTDYYNELMSYAVPLDYRALQVLKGSALALDVYAWLAHRLHRIEGRPVILYWTNLREQFGQEYQGKNADKDFKREFLRCLRAVLAVYPQAQVKQVTGGLMLMASPPPIPYKGQ